MNTWGNFRTYYLTHMGPRGHTVHMATTGKDLKMKRVEADVLSKTLAAAMGVTDSRISRIENSRIVTDAARDRYLSALDTCITKSTGEAA